MPSFVLNKPKTQSSKYLSFQETAPQVDIIFKISFNLILGNVFGLRMRFSRELSKGSHY